MLVSNAHENLTAEQRAEIDEIASLLGVTASYCSMGETDESDGYKEPCRTSILGWLVPTEIDLGIRIA